MNSVTCKNCENFKTTVAYFPLSGVQEWWGVNDQIIAEAKLIGEQGKFKTIVPGRWGTQSTYWQPSLLPLPSWFTHRLPEHSLKYESHIDHYNITDQLFD